VTRRLAEEHAVLAEIGRIISSSHDVDEVYERFAEQVRKLIPFDRIAIATVDLQRQTITQSHTSGEALPGWEQGSVHPLAGTAIAAMTPSRAGLLINAESGEALARELPDLAAGIAGDFRSLIVAPLISGDRVVGGLRLRSKTANVYTERTSPWRSRWARRSPAR
jgi:transcriptional regulator with GAF, ATPase, and Fis domain